jgi:hypothetical protein
VKVPGTKFSNLAIVGGLTAAMCLALAAILLVQEGSESTQRLALFFGIVGSITAALIGMLRADQAHTQTNGGLDARIEAGVYRAQAVRRAEVVEEICDDQVDPRVPQSPKEL